MQQFDSNNGILCPSCEYGIIRGYYDVSTSLHTYDSGKTRLSLNAHIKCPYCGMDSLICDDGREMFYNFGNNDVKRCKIIVVDL